ncbi:beta-ketoacyl-ACP synthase III [Gallionella capsiferriformans]|jgi:3-oxoacyl-[acyl-carrier-protein] synthase-3|uniref:Beta-ketoacyl-[acyl-carrier-protein] synthase III n=1 Tax=Gallionella capsiferriformans (strain ES-2) TaxID=395494 RepID=D9SGC4_GALCS|nr:beta-ketoacyl-ACP synthase III [Gallionella capsiferriformans]ADL55571.1 3-oxoacyl-(acyl-carrier-protein) synthase III [Gallionella capsiferriformans ES-2]
MHAKIIGTGSYLPVKTLSNFDLEKFVDTTDEWIVSRSGIHERHIAADDEVTSDLALHASLRAIEMAGIEASDIDLIIVATTCPDKIFPSTACILQDKLGIKNGGAAFDMQAVCGGFVYALNTADLYIRGGQAKTVLVVGAEIMSRILDWKDRTTCVLFGDGAGAVILQASSEPGILASRLHSDGQHHALLRVDGTVSDGVVQGDPFIRMEGQAVFKFAVTVLSRVVDEVLTIAGLKGSDIDWLVPHQANIRIIEATAKKLGLSLDNVVVTVANHGNTSSASIPLALDAAVRDGRIKAGQHVLLEAIGGGFTWGAVLLKW